MSQEQNVEIVRRAWEAAMRRPQPDFATVNALYDPAHELVPVVEGGTLRGAQGFREWLSGMNETLDSWDATAEEVMAIDDARVMLVWAVSVRGRSSGAAAAMRGAAIVTVREGKVIRTESYSTREQALEAVGPSEQDAHADSS
jgi:ketosteroid isomerase-like protein